MSFLLSEYDVLGFYADATDLPFFFFFFLIYYFELVVPLLPGFFFVGYALLTVHIYICKICRRI